MRLFGLLLILSLLSPVSALPAERRVPADKAEITLSFAPVAHEASQSVVNIYARRIVARQVSPFADDPFFSQFFALGHSTPRVENSLGSGVIVSEDGLVVSNHHVVGDASEIRIVLPDRREFDGEILLSDKDADIAVIRMKGAGTLPALPLGDADELEVGDLVLAIGNAFGVGQTVSSGIVSGLARTGGALGRETYFIQTDAPINPGNSGGALVDMRGRLVGLNTSILTRSGGSNGIGFAIPVNLVRQYVAQAEQGRTEFVRPWTGAEAQAVDHDLALALGMELPQGVLIAELHRESPFFEAGLNEGDVLLSIDGHPVNGPAELEYRMAVLGPGRSVGMTFLRNGDPRAGNVTLRQARGNLRMVQVSGQTVFDGLGIADVTPHLLQKLDLPLSAEGVIVLETAGFSARTGLRRGDRIIAVNGVPVSSAEELGGVLDVRAARWRLDIRRKGRSMVLELRG